MGFFDLSYGDHFMYKGKKVTVIAMNIERTGNGNTYRSVYVLELKGFIDYPKKLDVLELESDVRIMFDQDNRKRSEALFVKYGNRTEDHSMKRTIMENFSKYTTVGIYINRSGKIVSSWMRRK
jgi:hypothetical protein